MIFLFDNTNIHEHIFSQIKIVKSKARTRLTETHLENSLWQTSLQIQLNIEKLVKEKHKTMAIISLKNK